MRENVRLGCRFRLRLRVRFMCYLSQLWNSGNLKDIFFQDRNESRQTGFSTTGIVMRYWYHNEVFLILPA